MSGFLSRLRGRPVVIDVALAALVAAVWPLLLAMIASSTKTPQPSVPVAILSAIVGALPIAIRRVRPWWSVGMLIALAAGTLVSDYVWSTAGLATLLVTHTVASWMPLRRALVAFGLTTAATLSTAYAVRLHRPSLSTGTTLASLIVGSLLLLVVFVSGRFSQTRRAYTAALEERAAQAEANQRVLAEQAVAEERRRIARELHDVVAHHVSAMGVLATGARRTLGRDPDAATAALRAIEQTGRTALRELRRLLNILRADGDEPPETELVPAPGLTAVRGLIEQTRRTGLPVSVRVDGEPYPVDAGIGLTVYRLIQEALTNTAKHAGPAKVQVRLEFSASALGVEVFDTGRGPADDPSLTGHGLVGMRERVALYGGELHIGPRPGGGFRVYARIPMDNLEGLSARPAAATIASPDSPTTTGTT